jgi:acyl-coenzyme A synthetase/AMP-(fatty) acid ligase
VRGQASFNRVSLRKPINVGLMADLAAERFGRVPIYLDRPFDWDPEKRVELDYVDYAEMVKQMSAVLSAAGVKKGDRVAIVKSPNYDIQAIAWAAARIGAIPAPLSAHLDADIIHVLLDRLQPKLIVTDADLSRSVGINAARLEDLSCRAIGAEDGGIAVEDLWGGKVPAPDPVGDEDPLMITHTSSTTGISKLGETSSKAVTFSAFRESIFPLLHGPEDLFASAISHVHIRAAITQMASLSRGTSLLGIGQPSDEAIRDLFRQYRPTLVEAHPNAFMAWEQLINDPAEPFSSIRVYLNTFDAIHPRTIRRLLEASKRAFPVWMNCYGMTEVQVVSTRIYTKRSAGRAGSRNSRSVGWEVPGVRARIADPETGQRRRSSRDPGMIQVKTPARVLSFVGTPEKFAERRHGKWFDTGDWGRRGRWGQLEVLDRVADRISGVDSCLQIEDRLLERIPDAEEIVIVPDGESKAIPVICMRDGKPIEDEVWRAAVADIPELGKPYVVTEEALQRTATVKARRYLLTELIKNGDQKPDRDFVMREGA